MKLIWDLSYLNGLMSIEDERLKKIMSFMAISTCIKNQLLINQYENKKDFRIIEIQTYRLSKSNEYNLNLLGNFFSITRYEYPFDCVWGYKDWSGNYNNLTPEQEKKLEEAKKDFEEYVKFEEFIEEAFFEDFDLWLTFDGYILVTPPFEKIVKGYYLENNLGTLEESVDNLAKIIKNKCFTE